MFGLTPALWLYGGLGVLGLLIVSNGVTGYKAYHFGVDHEHVACQVRIDKINVKIEEANREIARATDNYNKRIHEIAAAGEAEQVQSDANEAMLRNKIKEYEDEINLRPDKCLLTPDDVVRLH